MNLNLRRRALDFLFEYRPSSLKVHASALNESEDLISLHTQKVSGLYNDIARLRRRLESSGNQRLAGRARDRDEQHEIEEREMRKLAMQLLPSLDALDRVIEFGEKVERQDENFRNWLISVEAMRRRLLKTLEGIGLNVISSVGLEVDLEIHDVVGVVPAVECDPNTVVEEQQRGYYFKGKLLRDAKVIIAQ